jgi:type I restriction enzyme, S subunit
MKWNKVRVGDFLIRVKDLVPITKNEEYSLVTIKLYHRGVQLRKKVKGSEIQADKMSRVKSGQFILSGIDARNGAFGIVPPELDGAVVTNDFWHFEIDKTIISNEYFLWLTSTPYFDDICNKASDGTTNRIRLQADRFYSQELLLPKIQDQHKVVEELKSRSNKISSLKSEYQFQLSQIENLNQAILQEAVQGKLVKQDKKEEPASELLKRIKAEKAKSGKKEKPLPPIKSEEIPFEIPESWVWCRLGETFDSTSGGTPDRGNPTYWNGNISWLKSGELNDDFIINDSQEKITPIGLKNSSAKLFPKGTLLIALYGATAGKLGILNFESTTNQAVCGFFENDFIQTKYLFYYLRALRDKIVADSWGQAQPNISQTYLKELPFALPPKEEQKRIIAEIEKQLAKSKQLKEHIIINQQATEQLLKALLHQAFEVNELEEVEG